MPFQPWYVCVRNNAEGIYCSPKGPHEGQSYRAQLTGHVRRAHTTALLLSGGVCRLAEEELGVLLALLGRLLPERHGPLHVLLHALPVVQAHS